MKKKPPLPRVYHRVDQWEEMKFNMWGTVTDRGRFLAMAIDFTGDHRLYGSFMVRVAKEWPISCENALTCPSGRRAWIGHAATAMAIQCPEDIVRTAWGMLTHEQRFLANKEASRAIAIWEDGYSKGRDLCGDMGAQMLPGWNS